MELILSTKKATNNDEEITTARLIKLICEIFDCIEDDNGNKPYLTILSEDLALIEFENGPRYRLTIEDCSKFQ
jgi:hypothetical protein